MKNQIAIGGVALLAIIASSAEAATVYGLTTRDQLVTFDSSSPWMFSNSVFISGLASNESLVGIDIRVSNNMLYGVGSFGNIYTLNRTTGVATFSSSLFNSANNQALQLQGTEFGVDFNPAADRLRVTSNANMNLRINVDTGATILDGAINGPGNPYIVGSAYTNNDNDPNTGTTLYNIDSFVNMLNIQNPPNNGTQVAVGGLGFDVTALGDIDILTVGQTNTAYGAFQLSNVTGSQFGMVNLNTGAVTLLGSIGSEQTGDSVAIRGIAVESVPEPASMLALGAGIAALMARKKKKG
ncbi:MAG: DUF4394 domain-containing protein [Fimbriimonadaceae bacterium]|nr:MAG: DUF4394 domain-containing protein [Fimbriimonadaceae bacterium]